MFFKFSTLIFAVGVIFSADLKAAEVDFTFGGFYRKYTEFDQAEELSFGMRGRYASYTGQGWGWMVRAHVEEHVMAPLIVPAIGHRWGNKLFFEANVGIYVGTFIGRNVTLAAIPTFGYRISNRFYISLPIYWDLNMGSPWLAELAPFIGYRF